MWQEILQLVFALIIFLGVLALTYYATQKLGSINKKMGFNKNMEIVEVLALMQGQYLYIVRAGKKHYLLGCSQKGSITYISEVDEKGLKLNEERSGAFQEQFINLMKGRQVKEDEKQK